MSTPFAVAALYRFVRLPDPTSLQAPLQNRLRDAGCCGTLLIAEEGINGTIAGPPEALRGFVESLENDPLFENRFRGLDVKWSTADEPPFRKARVRLKKEIVTMGTPGISPVDPETTGRYIDPDEWNALLDDPEVIVVDTRNDYEVEIGTFASATGPAVNPGTETFRDFPAFAAEHLDPEKHKTVAMFCTGGIRCEKSTALLKARGFEDVVHLRGGILKYLETVPEDESKFRGACFVFDQRVAVTHGLEETDHELCFACGWPTTPEDRRHENYLPGVACPRCAGRHTPEQVERFTMRQRQLDRQRAVAAERPVA
ncbi:MAG: rhodanese-related sulfurtransferase [Planctomycetota bacterium]